ncbi:MAG: hypothetical protein RLY86_49 [Pseudomonadota bacterium]|jgi:hypothetical protein
MSQSRPIRLPARRLICGVLGLFLSWALISSAWAARPTQPQGPRLWGLAVGINDYLPHIGPLDGAVNDARDIGRALEQAGAAEVVLLVDGAATREAMMDNWRRLAAKAAPGDVLVVSFAGHGIQLKEKVPGSEADGMDEMFVMHGFDFDGQSTAQRIVDDEISQLIFESRHLTVVMVADSCHSGTVTRVFDRRAGKRKTRVAAAARMQTDTLTPIVPLDGRTEAYDTEHLILLAAVDDHLQVPEVTIGGDARGALSWSVARAIEGQADADRDGLTSEQELVRFVTDTVRLKVEGQQTPAISGRRGIQQAVFPAPVSPPPLAQSLAGAITSAATALGSMSGGPLNAGAVPRPPTAATAQGGAPFLLQVIMAPGMQDPTASLSGVVPAADRKPDLILDTARGQFISPLGDVVATAPDQTVPARAVDPVWAQNVVEKWRLVRAIGAVAIGQGMPVTLSPGNGTHYEGDIVSLQVGERRYQHLTVLNLAADGTVNLVYPLTGNGFQDPIAVPLERAFDVPMKVGAPFGADHFIVIASELPLPALHAAVASLSGRPAARELGEALAATLAVGMHQITIHGVYSAAR